LQKTDFDAAAAQFRSALKLDPTGASLHHDLALALKLKDDLPGAIAEWKEAIRLDPKLADAYYSLGLTLWQSGDFPARRNVCGKPSKLSQTMPRPITRWVRF